MKILIAGIGNIFLGDDAFGVEAARLLMRESMPADVSIMDAGIRGLDLTYALMDDYDAFILIDAVPRGEAPGTLYRMEIDPASIEEAPIDALSVDAHALDPLRVLQTVKAMGGAPKRVLLIGCEPQPLNEDEQFEGRMGLSPSVEAVLPAAVEMTRSLVSAILKEAGNERQETVETSRDRGCRDADGYAVAGH